MSLIISYHVSLASCLLLLTLTMLWGNSADVTGDIFLIFFLENRIWHHANCLLRRQFAWSVKSYFLGKNTKNTSKCHLLIFFYPACKVLISSLRNLYILTSVSLHGLTVCVKSLNENANDPRCWKNKNIRSLQTSCAATDWSTWSIRQNIKRINYTFVIFVVCISFVILSYFLSLFFNENAWWNT